jgi:hypothetical protein
MVGVVYLEVDGPMDDAAGACSDAVRHFEHLAALEPDAFTDRLHGAAATLAEIYDRTGDTDAAARLRARYGQ